MMVAAIRTPLNTRLDANPAARPGRLPARAALSHPGNTPQKLSFRQWPVIVMTEDDNGQWTAGKEIVARSIDRAIDEGGMTAVLAVPTLDATRIDEAHFADLLERLRPDRGVKILTMTGPKQFVCLFEGFPLPRTIQWSGRGQGLTVECLSKGLEESRTSEKTQIKGRYLRGKASYEDWITDQPDDRLVTALPAIFNPGGMPNRSKVPYLMEIGADADNAPVTVPIHLWTDDRDPDAKRWTYAQALRTLAYFWIVRAQVKVSAFELLRDTESYVTAEPSPDAPDPFVARMRAYVNDVAVQSVNVDEALALLCSAAGLHYEVALRSTTGLRPWQVTTEHYLRVWATLANAAQEDASGDERYMGVPGVHDIPRDTPFADYTGSTAAEIAEANAAHQSDLSIDVRDVSAPHFMAGYQEWEVSLMLRPGWTPRPHLDNLQTEYDEEGQPVGTLSDEAYAEALQAARDWWTEQFAERYEGDGRIAKSIYDGQHKNHAAVASVFRKWIFPDSGEARAETYGRDDGPFDQQKYSPYIHDGENPRRPWWSDWTWGGGVPLGEGLVPGCGTWVPRRRPIRETIGRRNQALTDRSPIVRIHFGLRDGDGDLEMTTDPHSGRLICQPPEPDDEGWVPFSGQVEILDDQAGIKFVEDNLFSATAFREWPADEWRRLAIFAYLEGHFWVQLTGTVRGDRRMEEKRVSGGGATGTRIVHDVRDLGVDRFQYRRRRGPGAANSFLWAPYGQAQQVPADATAFEDRDDRAALYAHSKRRANFLAGATVAGNLELFYRTDAFNPGDSVDGCQGLGIGFEKYPQIERVRHTFGAGQRTTLILSDLRHNPEAGHA